MRAVFFNSNPTPRDEVFSLREILVACWMSQVINIYSVSWSLVNGVLLFSLTVSTLSASFIVVFCTKVTQFGSGTVSQVTLIELTA